MRYGINEVLISVVELNNVDETVETYQVIVFTNADMKDVK